MNKRKRLPKTTETAILTKSARRCAICFGLQSDLSMKKGQIAHLDRERTNHAEDNLAFLCFDHHDEYDSKTSQSKGLTEQEVKIYREQLYQRISSGKWDQTQIDNSASLDLHSPHIDEGDNLNLKTRNGRDNIPARRTAFSFSVENSSLTTAEDVQVGVVA